MILINALAAMFRPRRVAEETQSRPPSLYAESSGWRLVLQPGVGINPRFKWDKRYEFGRDEWEETSFFTMADQPDCFNIAGLYFREPQPWC